MCLSVSTLKAECLSSGTHKEILKIPSIFSTHPFLMMVLGRCINAKCFHSVPYQNRSSGIAIICLPVLKGASKILIK